MCVASASSQALRPLALVRSSLELTDLRLKEQCIRSAAHWRSLAALHQRLRKASRAGFELDAEEKWP